MARRLGPRVVAVALVFVGWAGAERGAAQLQPTSIAVLVYNRAHMRDQTLRDGEEVGKGILARAGLASAWLDCLSESGESVQQCSNPQAGVKLVITVIKRWKGTLSDDSRLGLAVQNPPCFGTYCYIFEDKLDETVRDTQCESRETPGKRHGPRDRSSAEGLQFAYRARHHVRLLVPG